MTSASEINLVGRIIRILSEVHSWCGETHIQKTAYIAKSVKGVPLESKFILYKHGPYSFELNTVLNNMRSQNIATVAPQGSYGSSYSLNEGLWTALNRAAGRDLDAFDEQLNFVCGQLARKKVAELERIATAVYVRLNYGSLNEDQQTRKLRELKPHIGASDAQLAFTEASVFFQTIQ